MIRDAPVRLNRQAAANTALVLCSISNRSGSHRPSCGLSLNLRTRELVGNLIKAAAVPCALRAVVKRSLLVVVSFSSDRRSLELVANTVEAYILDLVTDLDLVLWSRLVEPFKQNAGFADFLT